MYKRYSHREKKYERQILAYGIVLIVVVILMATIGLNILTRSTGFISNFWNRGNNSDQLAREETFLVPPELLDVPNATNSAIIFIHGRGQMGKKLTIFVNDDPQKEIDLEAEDFEAELTLTKGKNTVYAHIIDKETKEAANSPTFTVTFQMDKPKLEITSPSSGTKTNKDEIIVSGVTDRDISVRINDAPTVIDSAGGFTQSVRLRPGENKLVIVAQDSAGNTEIKEIVLTYEPD